MPSGQQAADHWRTCSQVLEWKTPNGCATCRPAVNYYLISTWPKEAKDDPQSRFINERSHANIQKDGTYSVIPRMWGGETTAASCAALPTRWTNTKSPPSRSPAASALTCWA
jgi:NAD(P)H-nitrite reductase large subunit